MYNRLTDRSELNDTEYGGFAMNGQSQANSNPSFFAPQAQMRIVSEEK